MLVMICTTAKIIAPGTKFIVTNLNTPKFFKCERSPTTSMPDSVKVNLSARNTAIEAK